MTMERLRQ